MRISDATIETLLTRNKSITKEQIDALKEESTRSRRPLQDMVIQNKLIDEKELAQAFADYAQIPFVEIDPKDIPQEVLNRIPERIARQYNAVLFKVDEDGTQHLAMDDPDDVQAVNFIEKQIGENIKLKVQSAPDATTLRTSSPSRAAIPLDGSACGRRSRLSAPNGIATHHGSSGTPISLKPGPRRSESKSPFCLCGCSAGSTRK